jgi:putative membrane protein
MLNDGSCQVVLTIPEEFSSALASASGDTPVKANLVVEDKGTNILVSQITARVLSEVRNTVAEKASSTYVDNIYVGLSELHGSLETAATSAGELATGIASAQDGAVTLQSGLTAAGAGAASLGAGLTKLESGSAELQNGSQTLANGASTLADKLGGASDGATFLAKGLSSAANGATALSTGLGTLKAGGDTLGASAQQIAGGADQLSQGVAAVASGTKQAAAAGSQLASGTKGLSGLLGALVAAHPELKSDSTFAAALAAASQVQTGAEQLAAGLTAASASTQQLATGAATLATGSGALNQGLGTFLAGVKTAAEGAGSLSNGLATLNSGGQSLATGLAAAQSGASALADGSAQLASGAQTLETGVGTAGSGVQELSQALGTLAAGSGSLATGIAKGADGAQQLANGISDGVSQIPDDDDGQREERASVMASPVSLDEATDHNVPNYGTGFAPYFIPLALWVGALMAYFLIRPLSARALSSTASNLTVMLSGYWPAAAITTAQAVIMMLVLQFALGLDPVNTAAFYLFGIFVALVSAAIMQFLAGSMGTAGKFIAVVLLMLQLTSAAGTFPLETIPRFFQVINPYLPMTYVVLGLRQVITLGDMGALAGDVGILLAFGVVALIATYFTVWRRRVWTMDRLKPAFAF